MKPFSSIKFNSKVKNEIIKFAYLITILNNNVLFNNNTVKIIHTLHILNKLTDTLKSLQMNISENEANIEIFKFLSKHLSLLSKKYSNLNHTNITKTRGMVSYSNRKLWKQKGTGRARVGSKKSPIFKGGGVVFGPQGNSKSLKINKKLTKKLFFASIVLKIKNLLLLELMSEKELESLSNYKVLMLVNFVNNQQSKKDYLKYSNYKNVLVKPLHVVNSFDILNADFILIKEYDLFNLFKRLIL